VTGPVLHAPIYSGVYHAPQPVFYLDTAWPWQQRHSRRWSPRYLYEQTVYVPDGRRETRLDIVAEYRQRVVDARRNRAEVDIEVEAFEVYENGRYLGRIDRIPAHLGRMRATVRRNGQVRVDRDVLLVGSRRKGFELIATSGRGAWHDAYYGRGGVRVGQVDLRRGRVREVRGSRLLSRHRYDRAIPVSLLPDDPSWLLDFGAHAVSAYPYDRGHYTDFGYDDGFFYGSHGRDDRYFRYESDDRYGEERYDDDRYDDDDDRRSGNWGARRDAATNGRERELPSLAQERVETVTLPDGESVELRREVKLRRVN
jgi:hypothetical protein